MKRISTAIKDAVINEHRARTGLGVNEYITIRKSFEQARYFVYWMDGEIERRDLYVVDKHGVTLEAMCQRENNAWIHLQ